MYINPARDPIPKSEGIFYGPPRCLYDQHQITVSTMVLFLGLTLLAGLISPALAAFGLTTSGNNYIVDAGSSNALVFSVNRASCDINSIKYRGIELQDGEKGTHISSGLGSATVAATTITGGDGVRYIKVTCDTSTLTQYYIVRESDSTIFLATHITAEPTIGELRFIARLKSSVLPNEYPFGVVSTTSNAASTVEGSDVYIVNGQTRSKFYSSERFIDKNAHCVWGTSPEEIHACVLVPQYESSSGGPFFRDIEVRLYHHSALTQVTYTVYRPTTLVPLPISTTVRPAADPRPSRATIS